MQYIVFIAITFLSLILITSRSYTNFYQISTHSCYMLRSVNMFILNEYDDDVSCLSFGILNLSYSVLTLSLGNKKVGP